MGWGLRLSVKFLSCCGFVCFIPSFLGANTILSFSVLFRWFANDRPTHINQLINPCRFKPFFISIIQFLCSYCSLFIGRQAPIREVIKSRPIQDHIPVQHGTKPHGAYHPRCLLQTYSHSPGKIKRREVSWIITKKSDFHLRVQARSKGGAGHSSQPRRDQEQGGGAGPRELHFF